MNKLGVYVTAQGFAGIENWKPRVVVTMNLDPVFLARLKKNGAFVVARVFFDDQRIDGNYWADMILPKVRGGKEFIDAVMAINEPAVWNESDCNALARETRTWSWRMHQEGFKTGAYSFSEGHPDLSLWKYLANHGCDYLFLHEYDAPEMWRTQGWRCLRYRHAEIPKDKPIVITETGIDGGVAGVDRPQIGWKGFGNVDHYVESLRWYRDEIAKDDYVLGAAIFAGNWNIGDESFNVEKEDKIKNLVNESLPIPVPINYQQIAEKQFPRKSVDAIGIAALVLRAKMPEPQRAIAIMLAESGGNPQAINVNPNGTVDRGLWQLNSKWYAKYSDECAFNPMCSTIAAAQIVKEWNGYGAWSSYKQGTYLKYMNIAALALAALGST